MKRYMLLFLCLILLGSCSKDDETVKSTTLSPPEWIHGTWKVEGATGMGSSSGFIFSDKDVVFITSLNEISHRSQIEDFNNTQIRIEVNETSTSQRYDLSIQYPQGQSINYSFRRSDTNTIFWENTGFGEIALKRQ